MYIDEVNTLRSQVNLLSNAVFNLIDVLTDLEDETYKLKKQVNSLKRLVK